MKSEEANKMWPNADDKCYDCPSMPNTQWWTGLTTEQTEDLLRDFAEWSGGCTPEETTTEQLETYIKHTADANLPGWALRRFLLNEKAVG